MRGKGRSFLLVAGILSILVPVGIAEAFSGAGSGTQDDPYIITNVNQLQEMNGNLSAWYELGNDIDAFDTINWNGGKGFVPIGTGYFYRFKGHFDGKGQTITGLYINRISADWYVGLFGYTDLESEIKNVALINVDINGGVCVGALAGYHHGTITNSYSKGGVNGSECVGGLVGDNYYSGRITNSYSTANVNGVNNRTGGLVGYSNGVITSCYSTGSVSGYDSVGGLVGLNGGTITSSSSTGIVTGTGWHVGGLVGLNLLGNSTITDCYSTACVGGYVYVGGLVGYNDCGTIANSYSAGNVSGDHSLGGLVGGNNGSCSDCFWDIETSGQTTSAGGEGKTTAQMQTRSTFTDAGWDFDNVWDIVEGVTYPYLRGSSWLAECDNYADLGNPSDEASHNLIGWDEIGTWYTSPSEDSTARCLYIGQNNYLTLCVPDPDVSYLLTTEVLDGECDDSFEIYVNGNQIYSYESNPEITVVKTHRAGVPSEYVTSSQVLINFKSTADDFGCPGAAFYYGRAPVYNVKMVPLENCCELFSKPFPSSGKGIWINTPELLKEITGKEACADISFEESERIRDDVIQKLKDNCISWTAVKFGDGDSYYGDDEWCRPWVNGILEFHKYRIEVFGWQYVYSYDYWGIPGVTEADVANMILDIPGIDGFIVDAETQYEGKPNAAIAYMQNIRLKHPDSFIAHSPFPLITDLHETFPYLEFGCYCDAVMPMAYWKQHEIALPGRISSPEDMFEEMENDWDQWEQEWTEQGNAGSVKPKIPIGQGWNLNDEESQEILRFCTLVYDHGYPAVSLWHYCGMSAKNWEHYKNSFCSPLTTTSKSPVDIILTDPQGLIVSKQLSEIPSAVYAEVDITGDGTPDDKIIIPHRKIGSYLIDVVPDQNALPTDTYGLEVTIDGQTMVLAEDVKIQDIPAEPYIFESKLNRSDFDSDGDVDFADYAIFANHWSEEDCNYPDWCEGTDLDYKGSVDFIDLDIFADNWLWEKIPADFDIDGDVDFVDYAVFANHWMEQDCTEPNWCSGADLERNGSVDLYDLGKFADNWLEVK